MGGGCVGVGGGAGCGVGGALPPPLLAAVGVTTAVEQGGGDGTEANATDVTTDATDVNIDGVDDGVGIIDGDGVDDVDDEGGNGIKDVGVCLKK